MHKYQTFVVPVPVLTVFAEGSRRIQIAPGPLAPAIIRGFNINGENNESRKITIY